MSAVSQEPIPWEPQGPRREEIRNLVRDRWQAGDSASEITFYFVGASRKAVIGIVHRMKIGNGQRVAKIKPLPKSKAPYAGAHISKASRRQNDPVRQKPTKKALTMPSDQDDQDISKVRKLINELRPPLPGTTPLTILELPNRPNVVCRFPVEGGYCGQPSGEFTYCETHQRLAYRHDKGRPEGRPLPIP